MNRLAFFFAAFLVTCLPAFSEGEKTPVIVDLGAIAGKSEAEVAKVLGTPSESDVTKYGPKRFYREGAVEIVFIDGKADWITIETEKVDVPFSADAIQYLGMERRGTDVRNANAIQWGKHVPYLSITANGSSSTGVSWFYVKVETE